MINRLLKKSLVLLLGFVAHENCQAQDISSLISPVVEEVTSGTEVILNEKRNIAPYETPSLDELMSRHKKLVESLGNTPLSSNQTGGSWDVKANALHYTGNLRLYKTNSGECLVREPLVESKLRGGAKPDFYNLVKEGEPLSMYFTIKKPHGTITIISQDGALYIFYPNGKSLKITKANSQGELLFRSLMNLAYHKEYPFIFDMENVRRYSSPGAFAYYKDGGTNLTVFNPSNKNRYGWYYTKDYKLLFAKDVKNNLYTINPESGMLTLEGKVVGANIIRVPEGLQFSSFNAPRVDFTNGSYLTYYQDYETNRVNLNDFMLKFDDMVVEPSNKKGAKITYEYKGRELEAEGDIKLPWTKPTNPQSLITEANVYDLAGNYVYRVSGGLDDNERAALEEAKRKAFSGVQKSAEAAMRKKYGNYANAAIKGEVTIGMPFDLVKEVFLLDNVSKSVYSSSYVVIKSYVSCTNTSFSYHGSGPGSWGTKLAYIVVSNGKVSYVSYY